MTSRIKTTAIFLQPFELGGVKDTLPAGEYEVEIEVLGSVDCVETAKWISSVLVLLHLEASRSGLSRTLTAPLTELERATAKDKLTGKALIDFILEEMLADPMICLGMQDDGETEEKARGVNSGWALKRIVDEDAMLGSGNMVQVARNSKSEAVATLPIDLDAHRTSASKLEAIFRRRRANFGSSWVVERNRVDGEINEALQAGPARSWIEAADRARFLLEQYAVCREAQDPRVQMLIKRSLVDLVRLKKRDDINS